MRFEPRARYSRAVSFSGRCLPGAGAGPLACRRIHNLVLDDCPVDHNDNNDDNDHNDDNDDNNDELADRSQ